MNGTVTRQDFTLIRSNPNQTTTSIITQDFEDCCYVLPALAEIDTKTSDLKNDKHSVIWFFSNAFTFAELILQKKVNGVWTDAYPLSFDNTYGTNFVYGFYNTIYEEKAIGYLIDWFLVLNDLGIGNYRVKCNATQIDSTINNYYSFEFCLNEYSDYRANETVRLEWYKNGNVGSLLDDTKKEDFGTLNYYNSIRLPKSIFGRLKPTKTKNFTRYQTGEDVRLFDADEIEYTLNIDSAPLWLGKFINFDANYSNNLTITDYNERNHEVFIQKQVISKTSFSNEYDYDVKLIDFEFTYQPTFNNFKHNYE